MMRRERFFQVVKYGVLLLLTGCLYGVFVRCTGMAVPCPFYFITGLRCPGCGVTRMCMALLELDFHTAFGSNPMLFLVMPLLGIVFLKYVADYVRDGKWSMSRGQTGAIYVSIVLLVGFAIVRNVFQL